MLGLLCRRKVEIRKEGLAMSSIIDEDELECDHCGHIGMYFNGDFDVECPACGAEYSLIEESEE